MVEGEVRRLEQFMSALVHSTPADVGGPRTTSP